MDELWDWLGVQSWISLRSSGTSALGCLETKCCLYVLGSGIWV